MSDAAGKANYQVIKVVRRAREFTRPYANDLAIWRTKAVRLMQQGELAQADAADPLAVWQDVQSLMSVVLQRHAAFTSATQHESPEVLRNEMVGTVEKAFLVLTESLARTRNMLDTSGTRTGSRQARQMAQRDGVH